MNERILSTPTRTATDSERNRGYALFLRSFLRQPNLTGAVLPSSRRLAHALMSPLRKRTGPARILEIGAGTGAVTQHLGHELGARDQLDICEMQPAMIEHLRRRVISQPQFDRARRDGRVVLLDCRVQEIDLGRRYDFVISALPFTAFAPDDVQSILDVVRTVLEDGGVFSYFEYVALRRLRKVGSLNHARRRINGVGRILDRHIERFEINRETVWANFPPAHARHWKFA